MKECINCKSTKTSQWYKGPICKSCYTRSPKGRVAIIKRQTKPEVRFSKSKRQAISRGKVWTLTLEEFCELLKRPCHYCQCQIGTKEGFSSCLDRLNNDFGYILDNVVPCCYVCNTLRNQFLSVEETKAAIGAVLSIRKNNGSRLEIMGMDEFLQKGDKFVSSKLGSMLHGDVARDATGKVLFDKLTNEPYVDFSNLHTEDYETTTVVPWKEYKEDGWSREKQTKLSTKVKDETLCAATWLVIESKMTGGGTGHGPHDVYPDGHFVLAQRVGGSETVRFYQSGCFRGMIYPKDIVKV